MQPLSKKNFSEMVCNPTLLPIEEDDRLYNLAQGYWVYDELLLELRKSGWKRIAPGFKSGLYGHPTKPLCIKILGMGVGDNPLFFCEKGYYLEHERNMLADFRNSGFHFAPEVLTQEDSIRFLIEHASVRRLQAEMRVLNNDLLVMEYISGVPFASQTGRHINYDVNIILFDDEVLHEMCSALETLRIQLGKANDNGLLHNDPMPPNIVFTVSTGYQIVARLVDFELAQNLCKPSPDYVNNSVENLYKDRDVPRDAYTGTHTQKLDEYLMDASVKVANEIASAATAVRSLISVLDGVSINIPFIGGININLDRVLKF